MCGCPAKWDPAVKEHLKFCRQPKRSCTKHHCWDKLYHADLDQEKLNQVTQIYHEFVVLRDTSDSIIFLYVRVIESLPSMHNVMAACKGARVVYFKLSQVHAHSSPNFS